MRLAATALLALSLGAVTGSAVADERPDFARGGRPFLEKYCVACHSGDEPKAELPLDVFRDSASLVRQRKVWDNVLRMIAAGEMPPKDRPRPTVGEAEAFTTHVKAVFDDADRLAQPDPGRVTMRRLNRTEYKNTVRDLLGVDFDPTEGFPADDVGHGFDNIGDVLTLSPLLMERYLDAAETIASRVIVVDPPKPSRRYLAGRFLQPNNAETSQASFRKMDPLASEAAHSGPFTAPGGYLKFSADADLIYRATLYAETTREVPVQVALFIDGPGIEPSSPEEIAALMGTDAPRWKSIKILKTFGIAARDDKNPQEIEVPVNRIGNINNAGIALVKPGPGEEPAKLYIQHLWSEGPLETRPASQLMILACSPDQSPAEQTREVLTRLLRSAYRRPATDEELQRMTKLVEDVQAGGAKWEAGIQRAIQVLLCSPKFLFRVELDDRPQSPEAAPLDEFQLASRLSYFLWSTMPDDELFALAEKQQLTANLDAQVRRMLVDQKSSEFVKNFALQWLQVQRLERFTPDAALFPAFNDSLRSAMLKETELFFESIMREDRSILDLLDADYTFLNEPLARHYGIADTSGNRLGQKAEQPDGKPIKGEAFQRVALQGRSRGGLLTQASVLTVTSNPTRTSPVKRGRWVLEQILGEPPPSPPPDVPELPSDEKAIAGGSLRQRLEAHRQNPSCANCHAKMDPIGFALENFDAIGAFRTKDGEFDVDPSGEFSDGTRFSGPEELKSIIKEKKELFARCLAEKMLTYALGRGIEYYDRPTVERVVTQLEMGDYKFSSLVSEIVKSDAFRQRRGIEPPNE
ncbi:MAG: DUF1592 domain-containing protein [Planctomycetota bacterium]|nr:DUF1592 domain-containing protein [Planctomycetota bacterium]